MLNPVTSLCSDKIDMLTPRKKKNIVKEKEPVLENSYGEEQSYFIPEKKSWWKFW